MKLKETVERELPHLRALSGADASRDKGGAWTSKQELGHLIDSAANNHVRFVRGLSMATMMGLAMRRMPGLRCMVMM